MIRCQACGTENPDGAQFCSKCARKLDPDTQAAVALQREQHAATGIRWTTVLLIALLVLVIAALVALVVFHVL